MKKMFKYVPVILGLIMVMSSCGDDDETEPDSAATNPSLSITVNGVQDQSSYTVTQGTPIIIAITGQRSDRDLDLIKVTENGANAVSSGINFTFNSTDNSYDLENNIDVSIKNADDETLLIRDTLSTITTIVGTTTYTFTLTEKDGSATSKSFDIVVESPAVAFTSLDTGKIWHIAGQLQGSYNLMTGMNVSIADTAMMADIQNTDLAATTFTGSFKVGSSRNTDFVVASSSFDYANATVTSAEAEYNAGTAVKATTTAPTAGDVYIFSVNGSTVAVKILGVDPTMGGGTGNPGNMEFEFKK